MREGACKPRNIGKASLARFENRLLRGTMSKLHGGGEITTSQSGRMSQGQGLPPKLSAPRD